MIGSLFYDSICLYKRELKFSDWPFMFYFFYAKVELSASMLSTTTHQLMRVLSLNKINGRGLFELCVKSDAHHQQKQWEL